MQQVNILGKSYSIIVSERKFVKPTIIRGEDKITIFFSEIVIVNPSQFFLQWLKAEARLIIEKRVVELSNTYSFKYNKIAVRDQSTRWGSCSSDKNLNFNWRLILAPQPILDYVIIHELAHTVQMNHSKSFWDIVGKIMPDYKNMRRWLHDNGRFLKIY